MIQLPGYRCRLFAIGVHISFEHDSSFGLRGVPQLCRWLWWRFPVPHSIWTWFSLCNNHQWGLYTFIYQHIPHSQTNPNWIYIYIVVYGSHGIMWYPHSYPMSLIFMVKSRIAAIFSHRTPGKRSRARLTASMWQPNAQRVTSEKLRRGTELEVFGACLKIVAFSKIGIFHGNMTKIEGF